MTERYTYARFWKCALQVNPYSYYKKHRGRDHDLTENAYNEALVGECVRLGVRVVGVADHGNVDGVDALRTSMNGQGIVVFPGFEITSSEKVHMVCLFDEATTTAQLERYLGDLGITDVTNGTWPSPHPCLDIARKIAAKQGFWYAAHATSDSGILKLQKDGGGLAHIWKDCEAVRAVQIPGSLDDLDHNYKQIISNRDPNYSRSRRVAVINAKDVATPADLAHGPATCLVKMTRPSFAAFKTAFLDHDARVRIGDDAVPRARGIIHEVRITNGYFTDLSLTLSDHLNAVIGGRGTGKSTLLECLRFVFGATPLGKQAGKAHGEIIKENLGKADGNVEVRVSSGTYPGQRFWIGRRFGDAPYVRDEQGEFLELTPEDLFPTIEFYGQNEIHELAQDQRHLTRLLRRFLPRDTKAMSDAADLRRKLETNRRELLELMRERDDAEDRAAALPKLLTQLKAFEEAGVAQKLAMSPLYAQERQRVEAVSAELNGLDEALFYLHSSLSVAAHPEDPEDAPLPLPNAETLELMTAALARLKEGLLAHHAAMALRITEARAELTGLQAKWAAELKAGEATLEQTLGQLPGMAGRSGREVGVEYKRLADAIEKVRPVAARLPSMREKCKTHEARRRELHAQLRHIDSSLAAELQSAAKRLNKKLEGSIRVSVRIRASRQPLKAFLLASGAEGLTDKRLSWIDEREQLEPVDLADAIRAGGEALRPYAMTPTTVAGLAKLTRAQLLELEEVDLGDRVELALNVARDGEADFRPLPKLSTGQQCTAVLHLLLLENSDPLVIDQPEDNLDNAFIAERIVTELRSAKTDRQFIFSTHNANIPVFGDAEWIGVIGSHGGTGAVTQAREGSIDVPEICTHVADLLEGGREAFTQRRVKYDF